MDKHQYFLHSFCRQFHTKRSFPFSLALRLRRICSPDETFTLLTNELIQYLLNREIQCYHTYKSYPTYALSPTPIFRRHLLVVTCNYDANGRTDYTVYSTGGTSPILDYTDCKSKILKQGAVLTLFIYKQYIGETERRIRDLVNEHRRPDDRVLTDSPHPIDLI